MKENESLEAIRSFEEKICFLEEQVSEMSREQRLQQQAFFKMEQKLKKMETLLKQSLENQDKHSEG